MNHPGVIVDKTLGLPMGMAKETQQGNPCVL